MGWRKKNKPEDDFSWFDEEDDDKTRAMNGGDDDWDDVDDDETRIAHDVFDEPAIDDGEKTVYSSKKKKAEILGFLVIKKGRRKNDRIDITKEDIIVGRSSKCCDVVLDDEDISKIHCRIRKDDNGKEFHFFDCGSTNGTTVNGQEIYHKVLESQDVITLGESVELVFLQV